MVLVSGGGRAEVRVWSMARVGEGLNCSGVGSALLRGTDSQRKKPWRLAQEEVVVERETRFLAVDIRWEVEGDTLLIYLACSDGMIRVFRYSVADQGLMLGKEVKHHTHCVLQVMVVESMVLTATTGEHLTVWDRKAEDSQVDIAIGGANYSPVWCELSGSEEAVCRCLGGGDWWR